MGDNTGSVSGVNVTGNAICKPQRGNKKPKRGAHSAPTLPGEEKRKKGLKTKTTTKEQEVGHFNTSRGGFPNILVAAGYSIAAYGTV